MKKLTLILLLVFAASCSQKKNSVRSNVATYSGQEISAQCQNQPVNQNVYGTIYDTSQGSFQFENRVKAFLSNFLQPSEIGSISSMEAASTGVRFNGFVKLDAAGNVVANQSKVVITVYDDIAVFNNQDPIVITFDPNNGAGSSISGQFNTSSGEGSIVLSDSLGEVRFQGRLDAQRFSGNVSFQNTTSVIGGSPASGSLGQFYIQSCAFLR